jgi:hypothetical protein
MLKVVSVKKEKMNRIELRFGKTGEKNVRKYKAASE